MTFLQIFLTILCVIAISIGQLLFKKTSIILNQSNSIFSVQVLGNLFLALFIYGIATIFWIYILKSVPLNKAYSFMALSFVFVTIGSFLLFNESINLQFILGLFLIIIGLVFISNA